MRNKDLIELLRKQDPEAIAVLVDRTEDFRYGLVRALTYEDICQINLGLVHTEGASHLELWGSVLGEADGPVLGLCIGPR